MSVLRKLFPMKRDRTVLFHRDFHGFSGGHLKAFNYFQYVQRLSGFTASIYFSKTSSWQDDNPWKGKCTVLKVWNPLDSDVLFLAGLDWNALKDVVIDENKPVVNLIQGIRHCNPDDVRYSFLSKKAIRISVSKEITKALHKTQKVNGPVYTISNGIDLNLDSLSQSNRVSSKKIDIMISGLKKPDLAKSLEKKLKFLNYKVECITEKIPRDVYLKKITSAKVSLLLPLKEEGFYLPALESMAIGSFVICPDCIGNRDFCFDEINCLIPEYNIDSLVRKTMEALNKDSVSFKFIVSSGINTAKKHTLQLEEEKFSYIMNNIDNIWNQI